MAYFRDSSAKTSSEVSEEQIISSRLAQKNRHTFTQLWNLYQPYLENLCRFQGLKNDEDIQDVVMMVFEKAWKKLLNQDQSINNFKGWLGKITCNLCIDILRQTNQTPFNTSYIDDISDTQAIGISSYHHPMSDLLQEEEIQYLHYWIRCLPDRLHYPVILHYYQKKSYSDIAQELSISQYSVDKRLQQARKILKENLYRYRSGLDVTGFDEAQLQKVEKQDFQVAILSDSSVEEINCRITLSCLETLPPVWYNFQYTQDWI
ncbi:MAG: sigma-70 family RNA polymerase sigma factor [Calothrix sp. MO_167.B12]|nr:sigma-70 family RNA polymerase sigma factor [Calothrix sp. MO_167.B12]